MIQPVAFSVVCDTGSEIRGPLTPDIVSFVMFAFTSVVIVKQLAYYVSSVDVLA